MKEMPGAEAAESLPDWRHQGFQRRQHF